MNLYLPAVSSFKIPMQKIDDDRGELKVLEFNRLPFVAKRYFVISVNHESITRGGHAHKSCWQAMNPQGGSCLVQIKNSTSVESVEINPQEFLIVPPFNWCKIHFESRSTKLNVFASQEFDQNDYIYSEPELKSQGL